MAEVRAELPPQSADNSDADEGEALWIVYSSAAAVGVAVAAFIVGFFLVKNALGNKRGKRQAEDATQSRSKRSRKDRSKSRPSAIKDNENDIEDLEANVRRPSSPLSFVRKKYKAGVSTCMENDASQGQNGEVDDDDNMEVIDLNNDDEVEVRLSPKEDPNDKGPVSTFFSSVASAIFPAETNDYFEKEDKASLPSKKDIDDNKSTYSISNNTFNTFFRNLDVVVNEGADASTRMPEAEMKTPSVHDRMRPTKLGGDNGDDEGTYTHTLTSEPTALRPLTELPLLGLDDGTFSASRSASVSRSRSSRSSSRNSQSYYSQSTASASTNTVETRRESEETGKDKAVVEPKKKSGMFKFFGKNKAHKSEPAKDEPDLREVSQVRASFLDDMAATVENSIICTGQDTIGKDGSKKSLESKVSAKSKKSTKSTPRPPLPPGSREGADPSRAPWSQEAELEKKGSKSGKSFSACSAELDAISTFSYSTYHDQTDDLPVVYREDEIDPNDDSKGKVSSLLSAYLSLGSKEDAANVAQQANDVPHNVPPASSSVHPEDKSHYSRKSSKSKASHRNIPSQKSHQSRSRSAGRTSHRSQPSQKNHRSQSRSRSASKLRRVEEEMGLEDVLALSEEEISIKSSSTGTRSRMSVNKGLRRHDSSIKRGGSSVRDGSHRTDRTTMYSTQTDRTEKIDNTSITKLSYAEKAAAIKQNDTYQSSDVSTLNETVSTRRTRSGGTFGTFNTLTTAEQASMIKKQQRGGALQAVISPLMDEQSTFSHSTAASTKHAKQLRNNAELALTGNKTRTMSTRDTRQSGQYTYEGSYSVRADDFTLGTRSTRRGETLAQAFNCQGEGSYSIRSDDSNTLGSDTLSYKRGETLAQAFNGQEEGSYRIRSDDINTLGSDNESKSTAGSPEFTRGATLAALLKEVSEEQLEKLDNSSLGNRLEGFLNEQAQTLEDKSVALGSLLKKYSDVDDVGVAV